MAYARGMLLLNVIELGDMLAFVLKPVRRSDTQIQGAKQWPDYRLEIGLDEISGIQA
jgi:hypothetical protein